MFWVAERYSVGSLLYRRKHLRSTGYLKKIHEFVSVSGTATVAMTATVNGDALSMEISLTKKM